MRLGGIVDISTKDIPGRVAMVIFTVGCNFNCEFCHNKHLLKNEIAKQIEVENLIKIIKKNQLVNSVSITGGEPTLQKDLIDICKVITRIGKYVSIDTNGSNPDVIGQLIPYVNRIALDIKSPLIKNTLERVIKQDLNPTLIVETFDIANKSKDIEFEVRTTYAEELLKPEDIHEIIIFLQEKNFKGNYVLQQYQYSEGVGKKFKNRFHKPSHLSLLNIFKSYRNVYLPFEIYLRDDTVGYCRIIESLS